MGTESKPIQGEKLKNFSRLLQSSKMQIKKCCSTCYNKSNYRKSVCISFCAGLVTNGWCVQTVSSGSDNAGFLCSNYFRRSGLILCSNYFREKTIIV